MRDADDAGQQLVFCNSYHLLLQPGPEIIEGESFFSNHFIKHGFTGQQCVAGSSLNSAHIAIEPCKSKRHTEYAFVRGNGSLFYFLCIPHDNIFLVFRLRIDI
jgi:hypothetical protein